MGGWWDSDVVMSALMDPDASAVFGVAAWLVSTGAAT